MNWKYNKEITAWEVSTNWITATIEYDRSFGYLVMVFDNKAKDFAVHSYKYYTRLSSAKRGVKRTLRNLFIDLSEVVEDAFFLSCLKISEDT